MDNPYQNTTALGAGYGYEGKEQAPSNALDAIVGQLDDLERRLFDIGNLALQTADRVFGGAVPINAAGASGNGTKESVNIPAIMCRIERLHILAGDLDQSVTRLSAL